MIFVFGSNEAGIHGAGAAVFARDQRGAVQGQGYGHYGDSFAIPTKDRRIRTLPWFEISQYVRKFLAYARRNPRLEFMVTRIGCGLAGLRDEEMAPLFIDAPSNCYFDEAWRPWLGPDVWYWGNFEKDRFEAPRRWPLHDWEEQVQGLVPEEAFILTVKRKDGRPANLSKTLRNTFYFSRQEAEEKRWASGLAEHYETQRILVFVLPLQSEETEP